tara:strand:- start:7947 stop:9233 length:1287 start_codon:yes stop_codon:yes gene_type:complete
MSKLETNSIGPWSKKDVEITGVKCMDTASSRDGVIRYRDNKFEFREDGVWRTLSDSPLGSGSPLISELNNPLQLVYAPNAPFSGAREGNVFKSFSDLYAFASVYDGNKEILFDSRFLPGRLEINGIGLSGTAWPDDTNCCVIPPGSYDFRNTTLMSASDNGSGAASRTTPLLDMASGAAMGIYQVPVLIKNGVSIKNLSYAKGLFLVGDRVGFDEPPIAYSAMSDDFDVLDLPGGPGMPDIYGKFSVTFDHCIIAGGGGPSGTYLSAGNVQPLISVDGSKLVTDPSLKVVALVLNLENSMVLGNRCISLADGAFLSAQDPLGASYFGHDSITTELDATHPAPTHNYANIFAPLSGFATTEHPSCESIIGVELSQSIVRRIVYDAQPGYWNSDPDNLEAAIHRLAAALYECRGALISLGVTTIGSQKIP